MRDIKFRVWDRIRNKMYTVEGIIESSPFTSFNYDGDFEEYCISDAYMIEDGEMMQYTGFKDKNGTEIYEGDIIELSTGKIRKVIYNRGSFKTQDVISQNGNLYLLEDYIDIDLGLNVVGNIYDDGRC